MQYVKALPPPGDEQCEPKAWLPLLHTLLDTSEVAASFEYKVAQASGEERPRVARKWHPFKKLFFPPHSNQISDFPLPRRGEPCKIKLMTLSLYFPQSVVLLLG